MKETDLPLNDRLTVEMTYLSNERSLLAYMRTFIVFLSSGFAILKIELFSELEYFGWTFIGLSVIILGFGIIRFFGTKKKVQKILNTLLQTT